MTVTRIYNTFDDERRLVVKGKAVAVLPPGKSTVVDLETGEAVDLIPTTRIAENHPKEVRVRRRNKEDE